MPAVILIASAHVDEALALNVKGHRFHDEARRYHYQVRELLKQPQQKACYIFDYRAWFPQQRYMKQIHDPLIMAEILEELAGNIDVPAAALKSTVTKYNAFLKSREQKDLDYNHVTFAPDRKTICECPFHATRMFHYN
ncbi:hypothetical protein V501_07521 [Pseudogymnoascus sp. VKM F-4519 (FW-2642)]|nr:hypothetical protein V501_07521 [Pseudogymnoascus sp. VKM F-4519 (FW-2642)]